MIVEIFLGLIALVIFYLYARKPSSYPPGAWGPPGIGATSIFTDGKDFEQRLFDYRKQYGDIFLWKVGVQTLLIVFDFDAIRETLNMTEFADRPPLTLIRFMGEGANVGLIASNNDIWKHGRRFFLRQMRDSGTNNMSKMSSVVQHEAVCIIEEFKKVAGKPTICPRSIQTAVLNVIWQIMAGTRYEVDDQKLLDIHNLFDVFQQSVMFYAMFDFYPWVKYIFPKFLRNKLFRQKEQEDMRKKLRSFVSEIIEEHEKTCDPENPRDYFDAFIAERRKEEANGSGDLSGSYSRENFIASAFDLLDAGSFTITSTLQWSILYLAKYPEIQKKIQMNVDEELPGKMVPSSDDRSRFHYVEAFLQEIHRHGSLASTGGLMRYTSVETKVRGFKIPKDTILMVMSGAAHFDPKYWEEPDQFKPERFLDDEGHFISQPAKPYAMLPFGLGKRQCVGENLAKMELFIFLTMMVQNLNFSAPPGKEIDLSPIPNNPFGRFPNMTQELLITIR